MSDLSSSGPGDIDPVPQGDEDSGHSLPIDVMFAIIHGYNKGPRPRAGTRLRSQGYLPPAYILMVDRGNRAHLAVEPDSSDWIPYEYLEDVRHDHGQQRVSLKELFGRAVKVARNPKAKHEIYYFLAGHFAGANGPQFVNPVAIAWAVVANCRSCGAQRLIGLRRWAVNLLEEIEADGTHSAESLPPEILELARSGLTGPDPILPAGDVSEAIDQMLAVAPLQMLALDDFGHNTSSDVIPLMRAYEKDGLSELVVLGPSMVDKDAGWVDVLDVDSGDTITSHLDDLDLDLEAELAEAEEVNELLWESAAYPDNRVALYHLLQRDGEMTPERRLAHVLLCGYVFRLQHAALPTLGRLAYKAMFASYKLLPKEHRSRAVAALPELVNVKSKQTHKPMGTADAIGPVLRSHLEDQLALTILRDTPEPGPSRTAHETARTAGPPSPAPVDALLSPPDLQGQPQTAPSVPEPQAPPTLPASASVPVAADPEPLPSPPLAAAPSAEPAPPARAPSELISFAPAPKPLRFKVSDYSLLSMEWPLPSAEDAFRAAVESTMQWLSKRLGMSLPASWNIGGHEIEHAGVRLQVEAARSLFALRLEHPDAQIPTRTWRVEAMVIAGTQGQGGMVGLRLHAQDRVEMTHPPVSVPGLVRAWVDKPGLVVGDGTALEQRAVASSVDLAALKTGIEHSGRDIPYWVVDAGTPLTLPAPVLGLGLAFCIAASESSAYAQLFGHLSSGQLHLFAPGNDFPARIQLSVNSDIQRLIQLSIEARQKPGTPSFREIRDAIRESTSHRPEPSSLDTAPAPVITLPESNSYAYNDLKELLDLALDEKVLQERELEAANDELRNLRAKLHALQNGAGVGAVAPLVEMPLELPDSLAELPVWSGYVSPRLAFADKALRFAAKTEHKEASRIFAALRALNDLYWPMRWGNDPNARQGWLDFLTENRMRCGPIGLAADHSHYSDAYQAVFGKRTVEMGLHIQGSSSRDPLRCIRIYFQPDEQTKKILIGHLPTHLNNTLT